MYLINWLCPTDFRNCMEYYQTQTSGDENLMFIYIYRLLARAVYTYITRMYRDIQVAYIHCSSKALLVVVLHCMEATTVVRIFLKSIITSMHCMLYSFVNGIYMNEIHSSYVLNWFLLKNLETHKSDICLIFSVRGSKLHVVVY